MAKKKTKHKKLTRLICKSTRPYIHTYIRVYLYTIQTIKCELLVNKVFQTKFDSESNASDLNFNPVFASKEEREENGEKLEHFLKRSSRKLNVLAMNFFVNIRVYSGYTRVFRVVFPYHT